MSGKVFTLTFHCKTNVGNDFLVSAAGLALEAPNVGALEAIQEKFLKSLESSLSPATNTSPVVSPLKA